MLKEILNKISDIAVRIESIQKDIREIKYNVRSLNQHKIETKSYQSINSKNYEIEITNWLYNYLILKNYSLFYYIPSNIEIQRELFFNNNTKIRKTLTDLDGIIVGTNNFNIKNCYLILKNEESITDTENIKCIKDYKNTILNNFTYDLHIIEAKHKLDISKIKKKLRQIIKLKKMINNINSPLNLRKFINGSIYLYFATPILKTNVYNFVNKKEYLHP